MRTLIFMRRLLPGYSGDDIPRPHAGSHPIKTASTAGQTRMVCSFYFVCQRLMRVSLNFLHSFSALYDNVVIRSNFIACKSLHPF